MAVVRTGAACCPLEWFILIDSYFSKSVLAAEGSDVSGLERRSSSVVAEFSAAISSLGVEAVRVPTSVGGWSPLQIAVHLVLSNELFARAVNGVVRGGPVLGLPKGSLTARGTMIAHGSTVPVDSSHDLGQVLSSLAVGSNELVARVQEAVRAGVAESVCFVNPYFGGLSAVECLQLAVVHVVHHKRQLPAGAQ